MRFVDLGAHDRVFDVHASEFLRDYIVGVTERTAGYGVGILKKTWGEEWIFAARDAYSGKLMRIAPGMQSSLHRHFVKDETFLSLRGDVLVEVSGVKMVLSPGSSIRIPPGAWHRFANASTGIAEFVEAGTRHDDGDVDRESPSGPIEMEVWRDAI